MNKKVIVLIVIVFCIFLINTNRVDSRVKNLYYDNFRYTDNVKFNDKFDYSSTLVNVGDYYEIIFDVVNDSDVEYEIKELLINESDEYFSYKMTYLNNSEVNIGDKIEKNSVVTIKYRVDYNKQVVDTSKKIDTSFNIEYGQIL